MLLVSCGGTGNAYVDEVVSITEDFVSESKKAETTKDLDRMFEDYQDNVKKAQDDFAAEKKELERGLEDFDDAAHKANVAYEVAQVKSYFYYGKAREELKKEEKK